VKGLSGDGRSRSGGGEILIGSVVWDIALDLVLNIVWDIALSLLLCILSSGSCFASDLRLCETCGLSLSGGVSFGDLSFFAACCGFGDSGGFGTASGFDTLGGSRASSFFCLVESSAHGGVGVISLVGTCSFCCMTSGGFCGSSGGFSFGLREEGLFANLFSGAMPQLRAILSAGGGEVAILCAVQIRPGVEDGYVFRGLGYGFIVPVSAARIHGS
jgi:hypothetical protein